MPELTDTQRQYLIRPLKATRVSKTQGMSYLEAFDVIAHLTRVFGWEGWHKELLQLDIIFEDQTLANSATAKPSRWTVAYRCSMRLSIFNPDGELVKIVEDVGTGEAINQPSRGDAHDLASKSAVSGALKRCAKDLGDQFGLGLYDKGSLDPTVKKVIAYDPPVSISGQEPPRTPPDEAPRSPTVPEPEGSLEARAKALTATAVKGDITDRSRKKIFAKAGEKGYGATVREIAGQVTDRQITSINELTEAEAVAVIAHLEAMDKWAPQPGEEPF